MEPIAKRLKQSAEAALSGVASSKKSAQDDIAEQIRRLEAELQGGGGASSSDEEDSADEDDSDDGSSSADDSEDESLKDAATEKKKTKTKETAVLSLSAYADDRVEGLPEHLLPKATATAANLSDKKKKRKNREEDKATSTSTSLLDELQWPKKVPFACKPCGFVGKDLEDFLAHRQSQEHLAKQQNVGGVLMCKLCDKSFTSPQQLEDHKVGKWHLQRAQQRKARHVVKVCYDFMRGSCKWGDRCSFEHTETKAMKSGRAFDKTKKRVCDIFQRRGKCSYGDSCMFAHVKAES